MCDGIILYTIIAVNFGTPLRMRYKNVIVNLFLKKKKKICFDSFFSVHIVTRKTDLFFFFKPVLNTSGSDLIQYVLLCMKYHRMGNNGMAKKRFALMKGVFFLLRSRTY